VTTAKINLLITYNGINPAIFAPSFEKGG